MEKENSIGKIKLIANWNHFLIKNNSFFSLYVTEILFENIRFGYTVHWQQNS